MPFPFQQSSLTTTHLWLTVRTITPIELESYSGGSLRGSLFNAIWRRFCTNRSASSCADCPLHETCAVSALVAPLREERTGGQDIPRPYVILPPIEGARRYASGEQFSFGITLIGTIIELLPYLLLSLRQLEAEGLGHRLPENKGQRGRFLVERVECVHPFQEQRQTIYEQGKTEVQVPLVSVHPQDYLIRASQLNRKELSIRFITPLRLVHQGHLVKKVSFSPLVQRLLERSLALEQSYGSEQVTVSREEKAHWLHLADRIMCSHDETGWQDLQSYSSRQQRTTPIGGLIGTATFVGDLTPFLELLVLGEVIHVGKDVVKGNGWYTLVS